METETCSNQEATNVTKVEENSRPFFQSITKRFRISRYERMKALDNDNSRIRRTSKSKEVKSCVAHFAYDFTGGFPRRISNIVEEEVDSLCQQMGGMDTESTSQERSRIKRKKRLLNHLRDQKERLEKKCSD
ncbi:hypothetical protein JTE90_012466 [Oedothorax gibbosus]|uniref:Uncharacterized protein n=1 Tax=Oedothorax gibbosus TaxID=931172 RepID=A0AAV6UDJ6_9ARAC|nr:hypothetical protein JTE90_012466 [Oedothorax gibbosus]